MAIGIRRHGGRALAEINVTPLVDVVMVLLIIFMLTAPVLQSGIEVSVPKTRLVKAIAAERLIVTITRSQDVYVGNEVVNINNIGDKIKEKIRDPQGQSGFLRADENVAFGAFATVMSAIKEAGIANISIVTEPI